MHQPQPVSLFQAFPIELIARHILTFLPFREVLALQRVSAQFHNAIQTAYWSKKLETQTDDWVQLQTRLWILRVLPHVRSLVICGPPPLQSLDDVATDLRHVNGRTEGAAAAAPTALSLFECLEELYDSGALLDTLDAVGVRWTFPHLRRLVLTCSSGDFNVPRPLGRLVSERMPLLRQLDIPWGTPEFSDTTHSVTLATLNAPRAWSLHEASRRLASLPTGSCIQELSVTHSVAATLPRDVAVLRERLSTTLKVQIYNLHVELPAPNAFWQLLETGGIAFETCTIDMDRAGAIIQPHVLFPALRRLEFRNLDPERHATVFRCLRFREAPHLVFVRGIHVMEEQPGIARLFHKHPDFQCEFRLAFDIYDLGCKARVRQIWTQHCPCARVM